MSDKQIIDNAVNVSNTLLVVSMLCILLGFFLSIVKRIEQDETFKEIIKSAFNFKSLYRKIIDLIYGAKYIVRVNGVWSVCRGRCNKDNVLKIKYGKDKHTWVLDGRNWIAISKNWSDEMIEIRVAQSNIDELKRDHPKKRKNACKISIAWENPSYVNYIRDNNL